MRGTSLGTSSGYRITSCRCCRQRNSATAALFDPFTNPRAGPLPCEDLLQFVSRVTTEPPGRGAKKIEIHWPLRGLIGRSGVRHILGTAREALHGDEVFSTNDA